MIRLCRTVVVVALSLFAIPAKTASGQSGRTGTEHDQNRSAQRVNELLGRFLERYDSLQISKFQCETIEVASKFRIIGFSSKQMEAAKLAGRTVEIHGHDMIILRRLRVVFDGSSGAARWVLRVPSDVNQQLDRIDRMWKDGSCWTFFEGFPDEAVKQPDAKLDFAALKSWLAAPNNSTLELIRSFENFAFMVQFLIRILPQDFDLKLLVEDSEGFSLESVGLGLRFTCGPDGTLRRVRLQESAGTFREVVYEGQVEAPNLEFQFPKYEITRGWKVGEPEPAETVENQGFKQHVSLNVLTKLPAGTLDWKTHVPFEFSSAENVVRDREGKQSDTRTNDRARLTPPSPR